MCNNLDNPLWGTVGVDMKRVLASQYYNLYGAPRGGLASTNAECTTGGRDGRACFSNGQRRLPNAR